MLSSLCYTNTSSRILTLLAHWNNSQRVDRSLHSGILSRFRANQPFLLLLNTACLVKKQQKSNFIVFAFTRQGLHIFQLIDIEKKHNIYE
jgi:hypothetical protein